MGTEHSQTKRGPILFSVTSQNESVEPLSINDVAEMWVVQIVADPSANVKAPIAMINEVISLMKQENLISVQFPYDSNSAIGGKIALS
jgi:hypothetical protein